MDRATGEISPAITAMAERIVRTVDPLQVVLFGSHARGTAGPRSDVDLLVVVPDGRDETQVRRAADEALRGSSSPFDLLVANAGRVRRLGNLVGTVFRPALREGILLYNTAAERPWELSPAAQLEADSVTESERLRQTRTWLEQAEDDLRAAEGSLQPVYLAPGPACYLSQQAAEKALKAILVFLQIDYPLTHKLDEVCAAIPVDWAVRAEYSDLKWLSEWAITGRYPGDWPQATESDARRAVAQARAIRDSVRRDLAEHGYDPEVR